MALFKKPQPYRFTPDSPVEMHFHDHDETWIVMGGKGTASMVDTDGTESEFEIEQGDIWMVEAGVEHGVMPTTDEASKTWSWMLGESDKKLLPELLDQLQ